MEGTRRARPVRRRRGYTLIELLIGLAVVATTLAWGVPSFGDFSRNAARTREVNQFIQAVYLARSEAIKRNGVVSLCPSRDGATCSPSSLWATGWLIFVNLDRDSPATRDGGEELLPGLPTLGVWPDRRRIEPRSPFDRLARAASRRRSRSATTEEVPQRAPSSSARQVAPALRTGTRRAVP